ncbi:MAG TPA: glycosyltransferase family 4 protein [Terriglobia bacterium]|nr:glycosyltransferase family 4 protein [Terriglobia bacterium]
MNILMAAPVAKAREGGIAGQMYNLGYELERKGHSVDYLFHEDLLNKRFLPRRFDILTFSINLAFRILRGQKKYSIANIYAPCGLAYGLLRKTLRLKQSPPYVMAMPGLEERRIYAMGREAKKGRAMYFRLKNRLWQRFYHQPTYRLAIRTADRSFVANRETWSILQIKYHQDASRVWYVPNGVEERFFLQRMYQPEPALRLLFVGQWLDHKGIYYLRDAFEILARKLPGVQITIAGCLTSSDPVVNFFPPSVRSQIRVIPQVERAKMPALYLDHDIFVLPSLMEGMPLVLLEAMATGMPVVTTETCGMMDIVQDEANGLLVPPGETTPLVEAMVRLVQSPELRQRLGKAAQESMRHYTWEKVARGVEKLFELAVQQDGAR